MKLRLILKTNTKKNKEVSLKLNIAPSKHLGFINFINLALKQDSQIQISFEKISKSGEREESKIAGQFKFTGKDSVGLQQLEEEIQENEKKKKKQHERRKHK
ncbi:MAG: hypothetical protein EU532_13350 [Promethearchaeota archaeon]|nr:MAG: hypothetical protein EU532_13350 [Candidatus Lokiarchaeota archaeon]